MTEVILITDATNDVWDVFAQSCTDILELASGEEGSEWETMVGCSGGADLVESAESLRIFLISHDQCPLFEREVGQT